jgi:hypothetical protein
MIDEQERARLDALPKKKRGRPKKVQEPPKEPPACEKSELAKYPDPEKYVAWGLEPQTPRFKRKGIAILYNPEHPGGQVTLMPVKMESDGLRWRYRWIQGVPRPFSYEKFDLEPGEAAELVKKLTEFIKEHFGDIKGADQTTVDYHEEVKKDSLGEKIRKEGIW